VLGESAAFQCVLRQLQQMTVAGKQQHLGPFRKIGQCSKDVRGKLVI